MVDMMIQALVSTLPVYVFFAIGFWLRAKGALRPEDDRPLLQLAMDVAYPCLIFYSIMRYMALEADPRIAGIGFSLQAAACGFAEMAIGVAAAWLVARALRLRIGSGLRTFTLTAGMQNYAYFVIPIVQMLFSASGDPTLGVLFIHNVGCEVFVWSLGVILMQGNIRALDMGVFLRGPLLAVVVSVLLAWTGWGSYVAQPPVMKAAEMIGAIATPVSLILFGCFMRDMLASFVWQPRMLLSGVAARLLITPSLILLLAWLLPVDPLIKRIMVIQSAIPSGVIPVMLAKRFGGRPEVGTQVLLSTTLCSFLTLPVWLAVGNAFVVHIFGS